MIIPKVKSKKKKTIKNYLPKLDDLTTQINAYKA